MNIELFEAMITARTKSLIVDPTGWALTRRHAGKLIRRDAGGELSRAVPMQDVQRAFELFQRDQELEQKVDVWKQSRSLGSWSLTRGPQGCGF